MGRGPFGCIPKAPLSNLAGSYNLWYFTTSSPVQYYVPIGRINHSLSRIFFLQNLKGSYFVTNSLDTIQKIETFINTSNNSSNCEIGMESKAIKDNIIDQKVFTKIRIYDGNAASIVVGN